MNKNNTVCNKKSLKINTNKYYYPLDVEQSLINNIKAGNADKALEILDEVFKINFSINILSFSLSRCLMFNLIGTIIKTMDNLSFLCDDSFLMRVNPIERLLNCETTMTLRIEMKDVIKAICKHVRNSDNNNVLVLRDRIMQYVESNYNDTNLGVSMIADKFNMSITYLSKFFKKQTGEGLLDYINRIRVEKAKKLLAMQEVNVKDVAKINGFYNCNSFIRIFKKYEGITPGQYKQITYRSRQVLFM